MNVASVDASALMDENAPSTEVSGAMAKDQDQRPQHTQKRSASVSSTYSSLFSSPPVPQEELEAAASVDDVAMSTDEGGPSKECEPSQAERACVQPKSKKPLGVNAAAGSASASSSKVSTPSKAGSSVQGGRVEKKKKKGGLTRELKGLKEDLGPWFTGGKTRY